MLAAIMIAPFFVYKIVAMQVMCFAIFAMGANLLMGSIGLLSLGQSAYFGAGGYVAGYLVQSLGLTPEIGIVAGGLAGAAIGTVFGWLAIRRQTIYFALITLALAQIVYFVATQGRASPAAKTASRAFRAAPCSAPAAGSDFAMYAFVSVLFIACFLFVHRIVHSPFGQVVKAIRENEPRAISLGYKADQYKWIIFILAAALAGVAGAANAEVFGIETLTDVGPSFSGLVVLMVLLGGIGTIYGPLIGALIVVAMQFYLAPFGAWVTAIQGVIFMACVLVFRRGLVGELALRLKTPL